MNPLMSNYRGCKTYGSLTALIIIVLLEAAPLISAQSTVGANDEAIVRLPNGDWAHDGVSRSTETYDHAMTSAPSVAPAATSWLPHPFVYAGPSLVGNGYQTFAGNFGGGVLLHADKLLGDFEAYYMNAKKTNDNTVNNHSGHERYLEGRVFYPLRPDLYFGGGAQWSETSTTNYTKKQWRPTFGVGGDHFSDSASLRWQVMYITPGTDHLNALQGPELQFWLPSPASKSHFIWRATLGIYEFHATVTDPTDKALTAAQISDRNHAAFLDFMFGWRF